MLRQIRIHERQPDAREQRIIDARPDIDEGAMDVVACWHTLGSARYPGPVAPGPIPYPAIELWARRRGLDGRALDLLVDVIGSLDVDRAERISSELRTEQKKKGKKR